MDESRRLGAREPLITSRMMKAVRSTDTKPELALRRALHHRGFRYRVHPSDVLGRPDVINRARKLAVFVDGDMWHGNPAEPARRGRASFADMFPTRTEWWVAKIDRNVERDRHVTATLREQGYTVVRLWESEITHDPEAAASAVLEAVILHCPDGGKR